MKENPGCVGIGILLAFIASQVYFAQQSWLVWAAVVSFWLSVVFMGAPAWTIDRWWQSTFAGLSVMFLCMGIAGLVMVGIALLLGHTL